MFIIRFIFYGIIAYFVMKLIRVFLDPIFTPNPNNPKVKSSQSEPIKKQKEASKLGDYIEYEEVKSTL
jgi:hypothetical protein